MAGSSIIHKTAPFFKLALSLAMVLIPILQCKPVYSDIDMESGWKEDKKAVKVIHGLIDIENKVEAETEMYEADTILTNGLGFERINENRRKNDLPEIINYNACQFGDEIAKRDNAYLPSRREELSFAASYEDITMDNLPSSVDNSQLKSFPPIGDQGVLNSCVSFSTTYYQMTHMFGMTLGWDAKNDNENIRKFSPKWTFNLTNAGENGVFGLDSTFLLFSKSGAALWNEFPYYPDDASQENYMKWPTDASVWRNALNYRIEDYGYIKIGDGSKTPVESPEDTSLYRVKQLINNGYVLTFETNVSIWRFSKIGDDTSTNEDDTFVDENIAHMTDKAILKVDGHAMTLVGYNDDIWVDINENGNVEQGEKGAFKIANSWGTSEEMVSSDNSFSWYSNEGFVWLSYDALNNISSVPDCPVSERRNAINGGNKVYWITPKKSSTPKMLIEYTINHANKYELETLLGYSSYDRKNPVLYMDPYNINLLTSAPSIKSSFDGTSNACDATFVFDISELYDKYDSIKGKVYLTLCDKAEGNPCTLKDIKVIDNIRGEIYNYDGKLPVSFDSSSLTIGPFSFKKEVASLNGLKLSSVSLPTGRNYPAVAVAESTVYAVGGIDGSGNYVNTVEAYDPEHDMWEKKGDMTGEQSDIPYAVSVNNRIYLIKKLSSGEGVLEEYNSAEDKWTFRCGINYWKNMDVVSVNGKIYTIGADDAYSNENVIFKIEEYDIFTNNVSEETYMEKGWIPISVGAFNGKIYIFGCRKYNSEANIQSDYSAYEFDWRLRIYDPESNSWEVAENVNFKADKGITEINGKFYGLYSDYSHNTIRVCEYDPLSNATTYIPGNCMNRENFGIASVKERIMLVGGKETSSATKLNRITDVVEVISVDKERIPPVLEPPENFILAATGQKTFADIGEADFFGNTEVEITNNAPESFPIGTTYVLWTAEDSKGNITRDTQEITIVIDMSAPDLIIPTDVFIGTNKDEKYVNIGKATVRNEVEYTIMNDAPQIFQLGKTTVEWTAVDNFGNMTCLSQIVNVYKYGDIDGNGAVNTIDFAYMRMFLLGNITEFPGELGKYGADVDGDSNISSVDFALMRQYFLGNIDEFPAGK